VPDEQDDEATEASNAAAPNPAGGDEPRNALQRMAGTVADTVVDVATLAGAAAGRMVSRRRRRIQASRDPIANLHELHPEARTSPRRELGLVTIPVAEIRGTAIEGPAQRGADFLPLPSLRGANWRGRWQRLRAAHAGLAILPPIDVLQTDDGYWVLDGHNRVALARLVGQDDIDAAVTHVHLPGSRDERLPRGSLETILADSREVRTAARQRPDVPRPGEPRPDEPPTLS